MRLQTGDPGEFATARRSSFYPIKSVELSRSAAVVLVRTPTSRRWKGGGMAHESPPSRASPRPLAGVLGCLTAACAPAGIVTRMAKILENTEGPWFTTMEFEAKHHQRRPSSGLRDRARQPGTAPEE